MPPVARWFLTGKPQGWRRLFHSQTIFDMSPRTSRTSTSLRENLRKFNEYILDETLPSVAHLGMEVMRGSIQTSDEIQGKLLGFAGTVNHKEIVSDELEGLKFDLLDVVKSVYSDVAPVANYLVKNSGNRFRPILFVLVNKSLKAVHPHFEHKVDTILRQGKMIQAHELVHTASLMHDDVIDSADMRRHMLPAHRVYGNRKAILGGDLLLARASRIASLLGPPPEVYRSVALTLENLVKGEMIQMQAAEGSLEEVFHLHLSKTYLKTASVMAEGCRCGAIIAGYSPEVQRWAHDLGTAVGMAFQIHDDILDITVSQSEAGKSTMTDAKEGTITSPLIFAARERPDLLRPLLGRPLKRSESQMMQKHVLEGPAIGLAKMTGLVYLQRVCELLETVSDEEPSVYARGVAAHVCSNLRSLLV